LLNWVLTNWASWISEWTFLLLLLLLLLLIVKLLVAILGRIFNGLKILKFGFLVIVFAPLGGCIAWFEIPPENSDARTLLLIVELLLVAMLGGVFSDLVILTLALLAVIVFKPLRGWGCIAWFEIPPENPDAWTLLLLIAKLLLVAMLECVITDLKLLIFGLLVIVFVSQRGCIALFRVFPKPFCGSSCHESPILT
jgi:hypothetical protein